MEKIKYTGSKMSRLKAMAAASILAAGIMSGPGVEEVSANSTQIPPEIASQYSKEELKKHNKEIQKYREHLRIIIETYNKNLRVGISEINNSNFSREEQKEIMDSVKKNKKSARKLFEEFGRNIEEVNLQPERIVTQGKMFMKVLQSKAGDTKTRVELNLNGSLQLSSEQLKELQNKYIIDNIKLNRFYIDNATGTKEATKAAITYSPEEYIAVQEAIKLKFSDLKNNSSLTTEQKVLIIANRINKLRYDHVAFSNGRENPKAVGYAQSARSALLTDKTICAGVSDAFVQVCTYLGIESSEIFGFSDKQAHAWNQVKIDEKWYNLDLTPVIVKCDFSDLLQSDATFKEKKYYPTFGNHHEAREDYESEKVDSLLEYAEEYDDKMENKGFFTKAKEKLKNITNKIVGKKEKMEEESTNDKNNQDVIIARKTEKEKFRDLISNNGEYGSQKYKKYASNNFNNKIRQSELDENER